MAAILWKVGEELGKYSDWQPEAWRGYLARLSTICMGYDSTLISTEDGAPKESCAFRRHTGQ
jgi:hypothetical protein